MSTQVVLYPFFDGRVAVLVPTPEYLQDHTIEDVASKDVPAGSPYVVVEKSDLPVETSFGSAWTVDYENYAGVSIDLAKAKILFQEQKDLAASNELDPLTKEYVELLASGGSTVAVTAAINAITTARDSVDYMAATDVTQLVNYWPAVLGRNPFIPLTTGSILVGRGAFGNPEDLNNSWLVTWNSLIAPEDTELYAPSTSTVMPFSGTVGVPYNYDSIGACFTPGNYGLQLRQSSTGFVLAEFECPLTDVENQLITFPGDLA